VETLDPTDYAMLFLGAAAHRRADRFVGLAEVQAALDQLEPSHGALIDAVTPRPVSLAMLTGVLKRLVGEGVSIRDLRAILEALAEDATEDHDVIQLTELARVGLGRAIVSRVTPSGQLSALLVDHPIEQTIREAVRREPGAKPSLALPPRITSEILDAFRPHLLTAERPPIVVSQDVRRYLRQLLALEHGPLTVLGLNELHDGVRLDAIATVRVGAS
jgi:type III secretion protein V